MEGPVGLRDRGSSHSRSSSSTKAKKRMGSFVQMPVATSQLTITPTPQNPPGSGPTAPGVAATKANFGLYVDSVNGTRPAGAAPRPIGCTQTNVFKRGEQFVLRAWGFDLATGAVLSMDNVTDAHFSRSRRAERDAELGLPRCDGEQGLVLDELLEHPEGLPARRRQRPRQLHDDGRQDGRRSLPDHDHPVATESEHHHEHQETPTTVASRC